MDGKLVDCFWGTSLDFYILFKFIHRIINTSNNGILQKGEA
jgi:hypothetical protein